MFIHPDSGRLPSRSLRVLRLEVKFLPAATGNIFLSVFLLLGLDLFLRRDILFPQILLVQTPNILRILSIVFHLVHIPPQLLATLLPQRSPQSVFLLFHLFASACHQLAVVHMRGRPILFAWSPFAGRAAVIAGKGAISLCSFAG